VEERSFGAELSSLPIVTLSRASERSGGSAKRAFRIDPEISSRRLPWNPTLRKVESLPEIGPAAEIPNKIEDTQNARRMGHPRIG